MSLSDLSCHVTQSDLFHSPARTRTRIFYNTHNFRKSHYLTILPCTHIIALFALYIYYYNDDTGIEYILCGGVEDFSSGLGRLGNFNGINERTAGKCD